jgi:hypothetical protein
VVRAQQPAMPVIGYLSTNQPQVFARMIDAFEAEYLTAPERFAQPVRFPLRRGRRPYMR